MQQIGGLVDNNTSLLRHGGQQWQRKTSDGDKSGESKT